MYAFTYVFRIPSYGKRKAVVQSLGSYVGGILKLFRRTPSIPKREATGK